MVNYGSTGDWTEGYSAADPTFGAEPGYRARRVRIHEPYSGKTLFGRAYANGPAGGGGSAGASEPATETVAEVNHVTGEVTLYQVPVEPAPSETVSLGVVVTP